MNATEALKSIVFRSAWLTAAMRRLRVLVHHARGKPHEADFNFLRDPAFASGLLLDLGANIGQSALSVAAVQPGLQIHSIEANPACEPGLKTAAWLLGQRFRYRVVGVGAQAGRLDFHVPVRASRMLLEEGTFDAATLVSPNSIARIGLQGRDYELQVISVPLVTVDSLGLSPRVVKMDLQGLELAALAGMTQTIQNAHPVFMIEIGEHHEQIVAFLAARGYTRWHWDGARLQPGVRPDTLNAIFIAAGDPALPSA
ncbi:MAG: FkbM family methyltransferase [Rubrivivax sp.]|nr:FkbM family methyltransferase [Rubrivivax sp.]